MKTSLPRSTVVVCVGLALAFAPACASDQKRAPTAEEVRDGEALPPAPPVPAEPASTNSPTAPTVPGGTAAVTPPPPPAPAALPAQEPLTEAQIAKVSELVNTAEVEQAKLAQAKAKAPAVKNFAAMMAKHHGEALREQAKIVKRLRINSEDSATSAKLKTDAETMLATLKKADPASFDAAYITSQIEGHQKALDLLDAQLIPSAKTPEVSDALRQARAIVAQHLSDAKALQK
jgi:putative membrane protein